jgi:drug/metabolite transporter (DMT)-like permease
MSTMILEGPKVHLRRASRWSRVKDSFAEWQYSSPYSKLFSLAFGIGAGGAAAAGFGFANALVHRASAGFPTAEITFARALVGVSIALPFVYTRLGSLFRVRFASIWVVATAGAVSILCLAWNIANASMALANILFNVFLVFVVVSGALAGEVRITRSLLYQFFLISSGVAFFWFAGDRTLTVSVGAVGLMGAVAAAIAYTALKKATTIADPWLINWAICATTLTIPFLQVNQSWSVPTGFDCLLLAGIGIVSFSSQILATVSFVYLPLALASALAPSAIVWSVVVDAITTGGSINIQGFAGATIYTLGICLLAARSAVDSNSDDPGMLVAKSTLGHTIKSVPTLGVFSKGVSSLCVK